MTCILHYDALNLGISKTALSLDDNLSFYLYNLYRGPNTTQPCIVEQGTKRVEIILRDYIDI